MVRISNEELERRLEFHQALKYLRAKDKKGSIRNYKALQAKLDELDDEDKKEFAKYASGEYDHKGELASDRSSLAANALPTLRNKQQNYTNKADEAYKQIETKLNTTFI